MVSPRLAWVDAPRTDALAAQSALADLAASGERLQRAAAELLDRAAFDGEQIASAAVEATVRLAGEAERSAFLREYLRAVGPLLRRYEAGDGAPFQVLVAVHPSPSSPSSSSST